MDSSLKPSGDILNNKSFVLGLAMLLIILYHMPRVHSLLNMFNVGFIGVDMFFFFSGYSLCYSYEKYSLKTFFKRRFLRIYPMYAVLALASCVISYFSVTGGGNLWDWFCNLTTLSYYKIGGWFIDWYLCSLFIFYLLFPILYKATQKIKNAMPIMTALAALVLISSIDIDWWYGCAIGRLPIFCLGIFCFLDKSEKHRKFLQCSFFYCLLFLLSIYLYRKGTFMRGYFLTDMITPSIILLLSMFVTYCPKVKSGIFGSWVQLFGKYSLEIYVANVITMMLMFICKRFGLEEWFFLLGYYFLVNTILAFTLVRVNKVIMRTVRY